MQEKAYQKANQGLAYFVLAVMFGIAGLVWMVYGFLSPRWILYPLIGVGNLAAAFLCWRSSH